MGSKSKEAKVRWGEGICQRITPSLFMVSPGNFPSRPLCRLRGTLHVLSHLLIPNVLPGTSPAAVALSVTSCPCFLTVPWSFGPLCFYARHSPHLLHLENCNLPFRTQFNSIFSVGPFLNSRRESVIICLC